MEEQSMQSTLGKLFSLLRMIHIHPAYLLIPIGISLLSAAFEGIGMGLLVPILNGFLQQSFAFALEAPVLGDMLALLPDRILQNDRLLFGVFLAGFVCIFVLKNATRYIATLAMGYFSERALHHLRKVLFSKYLSFGKLFFDRTNVGHHSTLLMEFSRQAFSPLSAIDKMVNALFSLIVYFITLLSISWKLTLLALPLFAILHFAIRFMIVNLKALSRSIALRGADLGKKAVEILSTMPLVKSYRTERAEQEKYMRISDEKARLDFRVRALQAMILPLQETITILVATGVLVLALSWFGRDQIASASALLVYFYIVINASNKFGAVSSYRGTMATASGALDEVLEVFDERGKFFVKGGSKEFKKLNESIEFWNLTFAYSEDRPVLQNVSFRIPKGKMLAIVGPTGAGKSTLIHLLMRYYDCPPASIFLDGTDLREFSLDSYLAHVALVSQETLLLHDSLRNNITYGLENVSEQQLQDVVERARLADYVSQLPKGLETFVGDRGVQLSGGEKQRVSIARALLKNADILILDEATSSLDSQTEKLIQEAIDNAVHGRTAIVIAHRLSTIKNADGIAVLEKGMLAEYGQLTELLAAKGAFAELWEQQKF